ncbi:hypothetical protein [Bradyrhizobium paxllaeri]|uniref:hypothetical protein n=1 Tax=Bradyrhizobium paxllaeri TaxID=190148 RepID=UPI0008106449|nr:hypothetical protein [Bradyrhizobium paxllaeri]
MIRKQTYVIIDDRIKPDALGQLGGVKVETRGDKRIVQMTPGQAKWYLENGAIKLDAPAPAPQKAAAEKKAS